jgi:hypothetical protein
MSKSRKHDKFWNRLTLGQTPPSGRKENGASHSQGSQAPPTELSTAISPSTPILTSAVGQNSTPDTVGVHTPSPHHPTAQPPLNEHFGDTVVGASLKPGSTSQRGPIPGTGTNNDAVRTTPTSSTGPQSLWAKAISQLDLQERETLRGFIEADTQDMASILESTRNETRRIVDTNRERAWKITVRGEDLVLRDVGMKILQWVDGFKEIGDIAAQLDPVHAALPWALFRFLLQVGSNTLHILIEQKTNALVDLRE